MAEVTKTFKYSQTGKYGALILLATVVLLTAAFSVYDYFLDKEITNLSAQIEVHESRIKKLESQNNVYVYSLVKKHKDILDTMDERSKITKYFNHLLTVVDHYDFEIRGFNMSGGNISSKISFENNNSGIAYKKAVRFIADFRKNDNDESEDDQSLLDLEFINGIRGDTSDIKFPVIFTIKK